MTVVVCFGAVDRSLPECGNTSLTFIWRGKYRPLHDEKEITKSLEVIRGN